MQPLLLERLAEKSQSRFAKPANRDPLFLHRYREYLFAEERRASSFTAEAVRRLKEEVDPPLFRTYKERESLEVVTLHSIRGLEEGSTASAVHGVFELANIVANDADSLDPPMLDSDRRFYGFAPRLDSGILDLASRPEPDDEGGVQVRTPTKMGVERKFKITWRDWLVTVWVLVRGSVTVKVNDKGKVRVVGSNGEDVESLSTAVRLILAQVSEEKVHGFTPAAPPTRPFSHLPSKL